MNIKRVIISLLIILWIIGCIHIHAQDFREVKDIFPLDVNGKVVINTYKGSISISTWDRPEVDVYAKIVPDGDWFGFDLDDQLENVDVIFKSKDGALYVESDYDIFTTLFGSHKRAFVHYNITMPRSAELLINDYKSDSRIRDVHANIDFNTYKGNAELSGVRGKLRIESYKGRIKIDVDELEGHSVFKTYKGRFVIDIGELRGNSGFQTYKGDVSVMLHDDTAFTLNADMGRKGDLETEFELSSGKIRPNSYNFDVYADVNGGGFVIDFETYKGNFQLLKK